MKFAKFALTCSLVVACNSSAKADYGDLGLAYLFGYGGYGGTRIQSYSPAPPYFAMHPPVYYGERYTRPYGASPFAAWPQLQANASYAPQPQAQRAHIFVNPYCTADATAAPSPGIVKGPGIVKAEPTPPLVIDNPYYQPNAQYTAK